jgi:DNA-binding GntR family transcriptional regulator
VSMMKTAFEPILQVAAPVRRQIAEQIRQAINNGTLQPGEHLVEKDLCQSLNVSRASLREALRVLQSESLLCSGTRGLVVAIISEDEAKMIYSARAALEGLAAEQFALNADSEDRRAIEAVVQALSEAYGRNEFSAIIELKEHFYEALCVGAKNVVVLDLLNRLNARINRLRSLSRADPKRGVASLREIKAIVRALKARDPVAAKVAAVQHVENAAAAALRHYKAAS